MIAVIYMYLIYTLYLGQSTALPVLAVGMGIFLLMDVKFVLAALIGAAVLRRSRAPAYGNTLDDI